MIRSAAAAVRGGRGSQHRPDRGSRRPPYRQRPPSAAAEDRNPYQDAGTPERQAGSGRRPRRPRIATRSGRQARWAHREAAAAVRGGRGSQQRRGATRPRLGAGSGRRPRRPRIATGARCRTAQRRKQQRPPSAAAEDRNFVTIRRHRERFQAAAAVRGGRGSQQPGGGEVQATHGRQRPPSAAAEDRNRSRSDSSRTSISSSGRRPRRPRIATDLAHSARSLGCDGSGRRPRRPRIATQAGRVPPLTT